MKSKSLPSSAGEQTPAGANALDLWRAFERLRRIDGAALAILDGTSGRRFDRDGLARLVDRASQAIDARLESAGGSLAVAFQMPNGAELIAATLACWRDGRAPMPLDADLAPAEVRGRTVPLGIPVALRGSSLAPDSPVPVSRAVPLPAGTAILKSTSGTTGEPRAVAVTADALTAGAAQIASTMGLEAGDRNLVAIPLAHSYAFDNVILTLATLGCPAVIARDATPRQLLAAGREAGASVLPLVPFLLDLLARSPVDAGRSWPELKLVISAGAMLSAATRERFAARFGVRPHTFYGATECGGIAFEREAAVDVPEGCVGEALDGVAIELRDAEDGVGRIAVRSASIAAAYLPAGDRGAENGLVGGGFIAPDFGRVDDRGRVHLLGRSGDVINVGGRKVYPAEIERVIRGVRGILEVVVLPVARSPVADAVRAVVAVEPGVERSEILAACADQLAPYKVPRVLELVAELPRTSRGKIDRRRLGQR